MTFTIDEDVDGRVCHQLQLPSSRLYEFCCCKKTFPTQDHAELVNFLHTYAEISTFTPSITRATTRPGPDGNFSSKPWCMLSNFLLVIQCLSASSLVVMTGGVWLLGSFHLHVKTTLIQMHFFRSILPSAFFIVATMDGCINFDCSRNLSEFQTGATL